MVFLELNLHNVSGVTGEYLNHTGQGSVSRSKQKSSSQHEGQQVRSALKMRPQCKDRWAQHSQEGEEKNANYRRENPNT